jgi:hypothetical protein
VDRYPLLWILCLGISHHRELSPSYNLKKERYTCTIMTPIQQISLWLTIVISISTIISVVSLGVRWLVKHYLQEIKSQLHTNGGSSIKDQVNRLESRQDKDETLGKETYKKVEKLEVKIDDLYDKLISFFVQR